MSPVVVRETVPLGFQEGKSAYNMRIQMSLEERALWDYNNDSIQIKSRECLHGCHIFKGMPVFNQYIHKALHGKDTIRLVVLEPATDVTAPVTCQVLERCTSSQNLDYTAVSYVWGKHEFSQTLEIQCDGDVKYLRTTPNLYTLLLNLRTRDQVRYLWIDAMSQPT